MQPSLDLYAILFLFGAVQAVFLAVVLLAIKRRNLTANRILAAFLAALAFLLLMAVAYHTKYFMSIPHLIRIDAPLVFVFGPLFYLYILALTSQRFAFEKRHLLHFVPFVIYDGYLLPFYLQSETIKVNYWIIVHGHNSPWPWHLEMAVSICHPLIYIILAIRQLASHRRTIKESFSSIEKINLAWIRNLLIGVGLVWASYFVTYSFDVDWLIHVVALLIVGMIYYMGFKGLIQPEIFAAEEERELQPKYAKSALSSDKADAYLEKLLNVMKTEKPYADSDLSLQKLAKKLAISSHHLSQIINDRLRQNFFEFVNRYRVEEAKRLIAVPENRNKNLAEIGFQAGFNSLSSFNAAFKKHAGMTPSQFRASIKHQ
ncbi:helix-turn-helix domain-containing protein [candidate division KSB1 bacterium]|nr:helix-turn-helix domain-containing protein [candidate division KSB1 bacterium]